MNFSPATSDQIGEVVRALGLANRPLCVHASLRSFGWLECGAQTVIDGLLSQGCTTMVPSFTTEFEVSPPANRHLLRNGVSDEDEQKPRLQILRWYSPDSNAIEPDMGALPAAIVATDGRQRGDHPHDSFSAIGPLAATLIRGQRPSNVYAPLAALADADGWVVLMGVDLDRMTLIHYAEQQAGRARFRRWSRDRDGAIVESEVGGCSSGFGRLRDVVAPLERTIQVGSSHWRAYPAAELVDLAAQAIRDNPEITHCADPRCQRCNDAVLGGPLDLDDVHSPGRDNETRRRQ